MEKERIIILGCTGSIGTQSLDLLTNDERFSVVGVSFNSNFSILEKYLDKLPDLELIGIIDPIAGGEFKDKYGARYDLAIGINANDMLLDIVEYDSCLNAISGNNGISSTLKAIRYDKVCYIANKESLVICGDTINKMLEEHPKSKLYPIDSEHVGLNKLLNYLKANNIPNENVIKYYLTASGGALRDYPLQDFKKVLKEDVLKHPTWQMGNKITVDSATMVNKAYEIIEASVLFNIPLNYLNSIICKESSLHAGIQFADEILYDYSKNDMHLAIEFSLNKCIAEAEVVSSNGEDINEFHIEHIDEFRYPLYYFILDEFKNKGHKIMAVINTADEMAIDCFLDGSLKFIDIQTVIEETCLHYDNKRLSHYKSYVEIISSTKRFVKQLLKRFDQRKDL